MKKQFSVAILSFFLLVFGCIYFFWSHNATNPSMPLASADGGYYDDAFLLHLAAFPGNTIYYTTDGSAPTVNSAVYEDGILIEDRSQQENVYNNIQNTVKDWLLFPVDTTPVPKGTVVRAISVNSRGVASEVFTQTYFVGIEPPQQGYTLSLVFEPSDVFGEDGIYVTGKEYDEWYLSGGAPEDMPWTNFEKKVEVPALMELMDAGGDVIHQNIGIRIQGASTRLDRKKRLILSAREEFSGSNVFDEKLFGVNTHSVMLKPVVFDAMIADMVSDRSVATQKSERINVYFNGEFWYTTYMLERYDNRYFKEYYGAKSIIEVEDGADLQKGIDAVPTYLDLRKWIEGSDCSTQEFWQQLQTKIDVQSYIDYVIINYYLANIDVHEWQNYRMWRAADTDENDTYRDTRWKWCIYDIDALGWAHYSYHTDDIAPINTFKSIGTHSGQPLATTTPFVKMLENPEFRKQFALSLMDMVNNNFSVKKMERILAKFGAGLDFMNSFFLKRPDYAPQHLAELMGLQGTLETVSITTNNTNGGKIVVNTSQLDLGDGLWEGKYFTDYPITVTAIPNPGYRFIGWKGAADTTEASITIPVDGGISLEAVFAP